MKRLLRILRAIALAVALFCCLGPREASADAVTDTISIYVGFFGWEEDQYLLKASYNWRDLDSYFGGQLSTHEVTYSYYSGSRTAIASARGFYMQDLLALAGVDANSIASIDFFTKDQTQGAYRSFTGSALLDQSRYYFPNLGVDEDGTPVPKEGDDLWAGAVRVPSMLALEDNWEWDAEGENYAGLSAGNRFRLLFGQTNPAEASTSSAAKYVYKILITFSGTPQFGLTATDLSLKVGSGFQAGGQVSAGDALLEQYLHQNLVWSSDNESIVAVDQDGNLTPIGNGEATITITSGSFSESFTVRVGDTESGEAEAEADSSAGQVQKPPGTTNPGASGQPGNGLPGTGPPGQNSSVPQGTASGTEGAASVAGGSGVYLLSRTLIEELENTGWVNLALAATPEQSEGALETGDRTPMAEDAVALVLAPELPYASPWIAAVAAGLLLFGAGFGILRYQWQK